MLDGIANIFIWFLDQLTGFFWWIIENVLDFFAWIVESIPVPSFLANMPTYQLPDAVLWLLTPFNVEYGLGVLVAAFTARFLVKLVPGI